MEYCLDFVKSKNRVRLESFTRQGCFSPRKLFYEEALNAVVLPEREYNGGNGGGYLATMVKLSCRPFLSNTPTEIFLRTAK